MLRSRSSDSHARAYLFFLMYHRGLSGQKYVPASRGMAGMKAEPSCSLHERAPALPTARLAHVPRKMPFHDVSLSFRYP